MVTDRGTSLQREAKAPYEAQSLHKKTQRDFSKLQGKWSVSHGGNCGLNSGKLAMHICLVKIEFCASQLGDSQ